MRLTNFPSFTWNHITLCYLVFSGLENNVINMISVQEQFIL